jgi:hypothetical protein
MAKKAKYIPLRIWINRQEEEVNIRKMSDDYLMNCINMCRKAAEKGFTMVIGGGWDAEDIWGDEYFVQGEEALNSLRGWTELNDEAKERNLI